MIEYVSNEDKSGSNNNNNNNARLLQLQS